MERMTQISSMQRATCGNSSLTSMPLWPYFWNLNGDGSNLPAAFWRVVPSLDWPAYFSSAGLGSKVSTCDGPPFMNKKMTRLARGGKCGAFGASGLLAALTAACTAGPSSPSPASTLARPSAPKPLPILHSICRRFISGCMTDAPRSIDKGKLVGAQQHLGVLLPAAERGFWFAGPGGIFRGTQEGQPQPHVLI